MVAYLTYWSGQGNAEIIRLMMAATGEAWVDRVALDESESHLTTPQQMEAMMAAGLLGFDQTPLLQIDGLNVVQKMAAVRYLARKHGMYGKDNAEATLIDILAEGVADFASVAGAEDPAEAAAGFAKYLPRLERALGSKPYLAGETISFADVLLFHVFTRIGDLAAALVSHPGLALLEKRIRELPSMASYLLWSIHLRP